MKLLVTTNAHLYKSPSSKGYYTPLVYGYDFFKRYLDFFDEVRLVAHVGNIAQSEEKSMLRVDGPHLEVYEVTEPRGKWQYIKNYLKIRRQVKNSYEGCQCAILRIPDQLSFQVFDGIHDKIPCGIEVTTNSWKFFENKGGILRPFLRRLWDYQEKRACRLAAATSYVTKYGLQQRYPPSPNTFTTNYTSANISLYSDVKSRDYGRNPLRQFSILHIAGGLQGREKGHKELIEAIVQLKKRGYDVTCNLVGGGKLDEDLMSLINTNELHVNCVGKIEQKQIKEFFLNSDLFVFPSYNEGLPRVVVEAMAAGIMCIATSIDGIVELLPTDVLVPVKDSVALAHKIEYYINHPEEMTKNSELNKENSRDYEMERLMERRTAFYESIKSKCK